MPITSGIPTFTRAGKWMCGKIWRLPLRHLVGWPVVGLVVAVVIFDWSGAHQWNAYRATAAARGVILSRPIAAAPAIPDADNFAAPKGPFGFQYPDDKTVRLEFVLSGPRFSEGKRMTIEKALEGDGYAAGRFRKVQNPVSPMDKSFTQNAAGFLEYCDQHFQSVWPDVLEAEARPKTQYPISASAISEHSDLSYLNLRKTAQLHMMRGLAFLDLDRGPEALGEIQRILRLTKAMHAGGEVNLIHSMIEAAVAAVPLGDVWEGLMDRRWSEAELVELQSELEAFQPIKYWPEVVGGERVRNNALFDELAAVSPLRRSTDFRILFSNDQNRPNRAAALLGAVCPTGLIRENQVAANELVDAVDGCIDPQGRFDPGKFAALGHEYLNTARFAVAWRITASWERACKRFVGIEAWLHEATTAVALERYRVRNHDLPERLEALAPEFLAAVPTNPVDGQPVRYARESDESYRLWCTAEYAGGDFSDVCETQTVDGHQALLWIGVGPEKRAPAVATR